MEAEAWGFDIPISNARGAVVIWTPIDLSKEISYLNREMLKLETQKTLGLFIEIGEFQHLVI